MSAPDDKIPKQELLAKMLKMTTSDNDNIALTSIRKANALLQAAGWDWDKLLQGKIKVAADPFANLQQPYNPGENRARPPRPPDHSVTGRWTGGKPTPAAQPNPFPPPPKPQPRPQPAPPPPPQAKPFEPYSHQSTNGQTNAFPGNCYCCGFSVSARDGKLFVPSQFNTRAPSGKKVICDSCDQNKNCFIDSRPAPQPKTQPFTGPAPRPGDL